MPEVPRQTTPLALPEMATMLLNAWEASGHPLPTRPAAELLLALLAVENGNGAAILNHNWGNLSSLATSGSWWRPPWFDPAEFEQLTDPARKERMREIHQRMLEGREPSAFEAHPDHASGALRWVNRLHQRFGSLVEGAEQGSQAFAQAYADSGYCASPVCQDVARFTQTFQRLAEDSRARGDFAALDELVPAPADSRAGVVVAAFAVAAVSGVVFFRLRRRRL